MHLNMKDKTRQTNLVIHKIQFNLIQGGGIKLNDKVHYRLFYFIVASHKAVGNENIN